MPLFKDADELYTHLGRLFEEALKDPELGPGCASSTASCSCACAGPTRWSR